MVRSLYNIYCTQAICLLATYGTWQTDHTRNFQPALILSEINQSIDVNGKSASPLGTKLVWSQLKGRNQKLALYHTWLYAIWGKATMQVYWYTRPGTAKSMHICENKM